GRGMVGGAGRSGLMATLICLGLGYCARHYVGEFGARFTRIVGTTRSTEHAVALGRERFGGRAVEMLAFDGKTAQPALIAAVGEADALLKTGGAAHDPGPRPP